MLCLLLHHYPNLTLGLHRNLFSVPVDLPSVRPVESLASSGSDQLSVRLRLPPTAFTSQAPPRCVDISDHQSTRQLAGLFNVSSPIKRPISPVQSNRSILSQPVKNLPALSKLLVSSKVNRSVKSIVKSNVNRSVKSSVQLKVSLSRRAKF